MDLLERAWEMASNGPTAFNTVPMRVIWVKSDEAKAKLQECLNPGNRQQTKEAAITAIILYDMEYEEQLVKLQPDVEDAKRFFKNDGHDINMYRNGNLQAGYFIVALRSLGLGIGAMSGFDPQLLEEKFALPPDKKWKINFLLNIGYPDVAKRGKKQPRLSFEEGTIVV
jgi:3-hydroxypropanoate dehydrogenase